MKKTYYYGLLLVMILSITAISVLGKGQLQKRVDFSINTPFALRMGDYLLPPGTYTLRQVLVNDPNLFALHPENLTNEPIAMIRTTRIDYQSSQYPNDTKLFVELDEASPDNHPVLQGWTIPGLDGWEVIGVVEKKSGVLAKVDTARGGSSNKYKLDRGKLSFNKYDKNDKRSRIQFKKVDN